MVKVIGNINNLESVDYNPFDGPEIAYIIPCSEPQVEILTSCMLGGDDASLAFNESISLKFTGKLNKEAMENAFQQLISRHESLRSVFCLKNKQICIFKSLPFELGWKDFSQELPNNRQQLISDYIKQEALHLFNLVNGPLIKACLIKSGEQEHLLVLTAHHIICDGWSLGIILQDLGKLYSAGVTQIFIDLPVPALFSQYAKDQLTFLQSDEYLQSEKFWLNQYGNDIPVLNLPIDFSRPLLRTYKSSRFDCKLNDNLIVDLKQIGTKAGCSLVTTLMAAFETFLYRLTEQDNIVIGLPAAGQSVTANYYLVGHCVNLLPLRSNPEKGISFTDYLKKRKPAVFDAYEHQQLTFGSLLKKLKFSRDPSRIPLVPVVFNIDMGMDDKVDFHGLKHQLSSNPRAFENFELFLNVSGSNDAITLEWSYNTQLFKQSTIERMMHQFEELLANISVNPQVKLGNIQLMNKNSNDETSNQLKGKEFAFPDKPVHELISLIAAKTPTKTALIFQDKKYTYLDLEENANQLALYLIQQGIIPGDFVGIALDRSPEMLITLLAIMKTGAAYIPLDPDYPEDRISFILKDATAKLLITSKKYDGKFSNPRGYILVENALAECRKLAATTPKVKVLPHDLVYVLYTSGSTGKPKGVLIEHHNLVNLLYSMFDFPGFSEQDILLAVTTIAFDIAGLELFLPFITGATMVLATAEATKDGNALLKLIEQKNVTVLQATPSTYKMMLSSGWEKKLGIKILCCGEPMSKDLAANLIPRCRSLWNMYGPTETTIYSTGKQILPTDEIITIGKPINNTQVFIIDEAFHLLPEGIVGEIAICGDGLARGYLNREELTREKFVPHPFIATKKMYRTGDLGKILPDGEILCLGRIDNQIKIRSYRIEAGEVENMLESITGIKEAVVLCKENKLGDARLVAYIVPENLNNQPNNISKETINQWKETAALELPAYMVPAHFEILSFLPLTPNGKIDRKALPEPTFNIDESVTRIPRVFTKEEQFIKDIWTELLDVNNISVTDNFFHLGGHSLIAIEVMGRIEKETGKKIPPSTLFQYPTISGLASVLQDQSGLNKWKSLVPIKPAGNKDPLYIIHGAGLDVMVFNNIARHMDEDQPVYGIKAKGKDGDDEMLEVLEEMAAFYITEMIEQNPKGPYALIGFSAGSVIAFEMAKQLNAMNKQVKLFGVIDFDLEELATRGNFFNRLQKRTVIFIPWLIHLLKSFLRYPKKTFDYQVMCLKLRYVSLLARLGIENKTTLNGFYAHLQNAQAKYEFALRQYVMTPTDIPIDLFVSQIKVYYQGDPKFLGWKPFALKGIKIHQLPGDHDDMILPPNDKEFAKILQDQLNTL
jgi:amino acid adenylation domain-containing protein